MCKKREFQLSSNICKEKYFNTEFNIRFIRPKSDQHDCCEDSKMNMEKGITSLEYKKLFERLIFLRSDRESRKVVLCFDMENVIQLPKTNISNFFYKRNYHL